MASLLKKTAAVIAAHAALSASACAAALQFRADGYAGGEWLSRRRDAVMVAVETNAAWTPPVRAGGRVRFDSGATNSPLLVACETSAGGFRYAIAISTVNDRRSLSTLIEAGAPLRMAANPLSLPRWAMDSSLSGEFAVDGVTRADCPPGTGDNHAFEVWWQQGSECAFVGGAPVAEWSRPWRGAVSEIILMDSEPTVEQRAALMDFFAQAYGVEFAGRARPLNAARTLGEMGVHSGDVYATVLTVR